MAGVLQFTLGLEVSSFLHGCGLSSGAILGLERVTHGLEMVMERTWGSIEQAGALEHLSRRTGVSVGKLFELEEGFKAAGVSAESVGGTLFFMEKALGGVNEMGEDTTSIFAKLGLSIGDLKKKGGAGAFQDIVAALGKLDQSSASKAAAGIFGRMNAANAVQLSRSSKEFAEAMAEAAQQAAVMDRIAAASAMVERTWLAVKRNVGGLFAGIAEGALPGIQAALDMLKGIDLTSIGEQIGKVLGAIGEAIASGEMTDLLKESFQAAWEFIGNFGVKVFEGLISAIETRFGQFLTGLPEAFSFAFDSVGSVIKLCIANALVSALGTVGTALSALGATNMAVAAFQTAGEIGEGSQIVADQDEKAMKARLHAAMGGMPGQAQEVLDSFKEGFSGAGDPFGTDGIANLKKHLASLESRVKPLKKGESEGGDESVEFGSGLTHKTEGNVFEKMGFVTGGSNGPAQETARNTGKMVELLQMMQGPLKDVSQAQTLQDPSMFAVNLPI